MLPTNRPPTSPGEILREEFLKPLEMTQAALAVKMGKPVQLVNLILNEKRGITAETAILLGEALGTSAEVWMGLQADWDLWHALRKMGRKPPKQAPATPGVASKRSSGHSVRA